MYSSISNGPCAVMVIITILITNITLLLKKPTLPSRKDEPTDYKRNLCLVFPVIFLVSSLTVMAMYFIAAEEYGVFIFSSFLLAQVQHLILIIYIAKTPNLYSFFYHTYQKSITRIVCKEIYFIFETIYDCFVFIICLGQTIQHFKHKPFEPFPPPNQIHPI